MNNHNYFNDAYDYANNYSNANGAWGSTQWAGFTDSQYNYADQAGVGMGMPSNSNPATSLPFTFVIANSTTNDVSSVVLLGANANSVGATNFGNVAAITITMQTGAVTYQQFLESIKSNPFKVGLMHLSSTNTTQPYQAWTFTQAYPNGRSQTLPLQPVEDPNQNQAGVTIVKYQFSVDAFTSMTTTILASATLYVRMYPVQELNVARGLDNRSVEKGYAAPDLYQLPNLR